MNAYSMMKRVLGAVVAVVALAAAPSAGAAFAPTDVWVKVTGSDGAFTRQAGAHADLETHLEFPREIDPNTGTPRLQANVKDVLVDLPPGVSGNPTAVPTCAEALLISAIGSPLCPPTTQLGIARIEQTSGLIEPVPIYNVQRPDGVPGLFAFNYLGVVTYIKAKVRAGDYGISALSTQISQTHAILSVDITLWGTPGDPRHDADRFDPNLYAPGVGDFGTASGLPPAPFLSNPTSCPDGPSTTTISTDFWQDPDNYSVVKLTEDVDGTPLVNEGCDKLDFRPTASVQPLSHTVDAPTGLDVNIHVPQNEAPYGLSTAHVKKVSVVLPQGMSVSPSSAAGLGACAPDQIRIGLADDPTCPDSASVGTVEIDTPLLDDPLKGDVYLAKPNDNPSNSLVALYIVAHGPGFTLKLPGRIDLDQNTGQLTTTFDNNPQLPFTDLHLQFRGGSQAPLATPTTCGTYNTHVEITSWASDTPVTSDTPMTFDQGCGARNFAPSFSAGSTNPAAGAASPFTFSLTRADGQQYLSKIATVLPAGLLARIASVPQCPDAAAAAGTCPATSQVGSVSTLAGPGAQPLALTGRVYLTGPYRGAPFGLSIVVPTAGQSGPFDLGNVVVRAAISIDRRDAHVTVDSDLLPTILKGFPLRLRQVKLSIDRAGFMINPTNCASQSITGIFGSTDGTSSVQKALYQPLGCKDLSVNDKLAMTLTGTGTTDGSHPGLQAKLTAAPGGANLRKAVVRLPLSLALDPDNAEALCTIAQRAALNCPKASIVGTAKAYSVLPDPLTGPVYFVKGQRFSPSGRPIPTLPTLWIPLSADGVTIDVNASSDVDDLSALVTTFDALPDAPFSEFDLNINGGKHGILVVSGKPSACDRDKVVDTQFTGQNGDLVQDGVTSRWNGCRPKVSSVRSSSKSITAKVTGLGAGRLSISGKGVASARRTIKTATSASIVARLTKATQSALHRHGKVRVTVTVRYVPKKGRAVSMRKTVTVRR
jgi:hypothetical protein